MRHGGGPEFAVFEGLNASSYLLPAAAVQAARRMRMPTRGLDEPFNVTPSVSADRESSCLAATAGSPTFAISVPPEAQNLRAQS
jgi:hypothetical protein